MSFEKNLSSEQKSEEPVFESDHLSVNWAKGKVHTEVMKKNGEYTVFSLLDNPESYEGDWVGDAPDIRSFNSKEEALEFAKEHLNDRENWLK